MTVVYDAGVFVAAERNDREVWADHRVRLELGLVPITSAPVVAHVSASPRQVQLRRLLRGCDVLGFRRQDAHSVGSLLAKTGTADVVDAHLVLLAAARSSTVLTSDPDDLRRLADQLPSSVRVRRV